jgi:hypothetical protein
VAGEEGLDGVAEPLADGHEGEQQVAAARGSQVGKRSRHHRGAVTRRAAAPVHELQLLATAPCQAINSDRSKLEFRVLRGFRGGGLKGVGV